MGLWATEVVMKVILKETIDSLGIIGSEVTVANGYARNYLLPQGKAVPATDQYRKLLKHERAKFELQIAKEKELAEQMAQKLQTVECEIAARVHEGEQLYGSVSVRDIVDALAKQDISLEKRMVLLKEPIKTIGAFKVPIRVYKEVEPEITVTIVPE
jgi:large subunit ribosomal protein L9